MFETVPERGVKGGAIVGPRTEGLPASGPEKAPSVEPESPCPTGVIADSVAEPWSEPPGAEIMVWLIGCGSTMVDFGSADTTAVRICLSVPGAPCTTAAAKPGRSFGTARHTAAAINAALAGAAAAAALSINL